MQLGTSYRQILNIALPIMLGSAAQNLVALSDSIILYGLSRTDFAAIGFVGVFYLMVSSIGYGFSKGGQIIIARRMGATNYPAVGRGFRSMLVFEMVLAALMFAFMHFGCPWFFRQLVQSPEIYQKSLQFLHYRSYGVWFSYPGVVLIALYTGAARTRVIIYDTLLLGIVNILLCVGLVYGKWGLPQMGIAGAGLASTIAEAAALLFFLIFMLFDTQNRHWQLFKIQKPEWNDIWQQIWLGLPVVAQAIVGLGSWFIFFSIIEKQLGEQDLAITNLARVVYLMLSIPCWGFASAINTVVSNFIGQKRFRAVMPLTKRTAQLSLAFTLLPALPICLFPQTLLSPIFGIAGQTDLLALAVPILRLMIAILALFSVGGVFFNALAGCGATLFGLKIQFFSAIIYLVYIVFILQILHLNLTWAWSSELLYWFIILAFSYQYLQRRKWLDLKV